ncbi:MAG: ABC transporter substrate-binding protein [Burkholderiales bacterium]
MLYSTMTVSDGKAVGAAFEKKYGVKLNHWRSSAEGVINRGITEARGKRFEADVYETSWHRMEGLPETYADLLHPRWQGRITIEGTDVLWFAALVKSMGEEQGIGYFKNLPNSCSPRRVRKSTKRSIACPPTNWWIAH